MEELDDRSADIDIFLVAKSLWATLFDDLLKDGYDSGWKAAEMHADSALQISLA